jgi:hypothetical protein
MDHDKQQEHARDILETMRDLGLEEQVNHLEEQIDALESEIHSTGVRESIGDTVEKLTAFLSDFDDLMYVHVIGDNHGYDSSDYFETAAKITNLIESTIEFIKSEQQV